VVLIGGTVAAVVVAGVIVGALLRQRSHDDVHSVEHYHRKLHTLEEMRAHPAGEGLRERAAAGAAAATTTGGVAHGNGSAAGDEHANDANGSRTPDVAEAPGKQEAGERTAGGPSPAGALRVSGSSTVRLTDADHAPSPPTSPPPIASLSKPRRFDDDGPGSMPGTFMSGNDRAMDSINHRPRRVGGPLAAIAAVAVLIVVLIVTGMHTTAPTSSHSRSHSGPPASHPSVTTTTVRTQQPPATSTTVPPVVSAPSAVSANGATYTVGAATYALALSATSGPCWIQVTDTPTGTVLFSATLYGGQSHTVNATGPVTVVAGAPSAFSATVNGAPVTLPTGYQTPFTLSFQTPGSG
jgi:hypothetical protein